MKKKQIKILIIRFSSIGDIILTTPVIRCIRNTYPNAEIHYLTKNTFRNCINTNPYVDRFYFHKENLKKTITELKKENYDFVIDLHHNLRTWTVKRKIGAKNFSFPKLNLEKWLLVNFKINKLPKKHIVDRYFEAVAPLKVENDHAGLDFFISVLDEVDIRKFPPEFANGYVAFVLSGNFHTKRLPNDKVVSLCNKINKPIILLGGKAEVDNSNKIVKMMEHGKVLNGVNKYGIAQSASIIKQADVVITNDTGMMHIAAAFKKRIISVWGSTIPEFGMTPYYGTKELEQQNSTIVEVKNLSCRPCSKLGHHRCPKKHFKCMREIDENTIINNIEVKN